MLNDRYIIWSGRSKATSCILVLPGRDQTGVDLAKQWCNIFLDNTMIVLITPKNKEWYPLPHSALDQKNAILGLETAKETIDSVLNRITSEFKIPKLKIAVVGFSAGGVMANYVGFNSKEEYAGFVSHSGAVLEPDFVPKCKFEFMPFVLTHSKNDDVFSWEERYIPMKNSFIANNYNLKVLESLNRHFISDEEIEFAALSVCDRLGYSLLDEVRNSNYFYDSYDLFVEGLK